MVNIQVSNIENIKTSNSWPIAEKPIAEKPIPEKPIPEKPHNHA